MESETSHQFSSPARVSALTASLCNQTIARNSNNGANGSAASMPSAGDLKCIKADLEQLLPQTENRLRDLQHELANLEKMKISDGSSDNDSSGSNNGSGGKNVDVMMRIKQESSLDDDQSSLRQTRRRRRDSSGDETDTANQTPNEQPHHIVKMKKVDGVSSTSRSMSPPPSSSSSEKRKKKSRSNNGDTQGKHPKAKASTPKDNDVDFVRVKPKDQVPIATFWSYVEPYLRPLTEDDRKFLTEKGDMGLPFLIPPLGRHYKEVWAEEDKSLMLGRKSPGPRREDTMDSNAGEDVPKPKKPAARYLRPGEPLTEDYLLTEDLSCGSLAERLLSSLVIEDVVDPEELKDVMANEDDDTDQMDMDSVSSSSSQMEGRTVLELSSEPSEEIVEFEERLMQELRYAGLFGDDDIDWNAREDDEICAELRRLGRELEEQVKVNEFRKKRLLEVVDRQLQYEQYQYYLNILDSQVEQCYMKRFRLQKSKKRKAGSAPKGTLSENAVNAMEKRRAWLKLEPVFRDSNLVMPKKSIYATEEEEGEDRKK